MRKIYCTEGQHERRRSARISALEEKAKREKEKPASTSNNITARLNDSNSQRSLPARARPFKRRGRKRKALAELAPPLELRSGADEHAQQYPNNFRASFLPVQNPQASGVKLSKLDGIKDGRFPTIPEMERRYTYRPLNSDQSLFSAIFNSPRTLIKQSNVKIGYSESLLKFVQDLGPTAQTVASRKLGLLQTNQAPSNLEIPNSQAKTLSYGATEQSPIQGYQIPNWNSCSLSLSNKPLIITENDPQQGARKVQSTEKVDSQGWSYKGKDKIVYGDQIMGTHDGFLGNSFPKYDKVGSSSELIQSQAGQCLNKEITPNSIARNLNMVSPVEYLGSHQGNVQVDPVKQYPQLKMGPGPSPNNRNIRIGNWDALAATPPLSNRSNNNMTIGDLISRPRMTSSTVWPTTVISGAQLSNPNISRPSLLPSQAASFTKWGEVNASASLYADSGLQNQDRIVQGFGKLNSGSGTNYLEEARQQSQQWNQTTPYVPQEMHGYTRMQPNESSHLDQSNFVGQDISQPALTHVMPWIDTDTMNQYGGRTPQGQGQPGETSSQLIWEQEEPLGKPNLDLQLWNEYTSSI